MAFVSIYLKVIKVRCVTMIFCLILYNMYKINSFSLYLYEGMGCRLAVRWVARSILHEGSIDLFFVLASVPPLM